MTNQTIIPIFFAIDNKYAPLASCAIQSIIENSSKKYNYKIFIIHQELSNENKENLASLATENFEISFKEMQTQLECITNCLSNRLRCDYFTLTIYFRIFIPDMFPEFDKGIYLDSDIIVPGDISELYNMNLENNLIGGCLDRSVHGMPEVVNYYENAIGISRNEYINSGVLLMNLKEMREKQFSNEFLRILNTYHFDSIAPDQDYLNAMCNGKILYLNEVWDAMPRDGKPALPNPKLIHYNLFKKPWCYDNVTYEEYFWKYAKQSKYYKQLIDYKNNYTEENKKSDDECLKVLLRQAVIIPDTENTFKKKYESGEKIRV